MNNNTDARFAIAGPVAKAKARMLIELSGGNNGLTHAHALEITARGCGFHSWKELLVFNEKRESAEDATPEQMLAYDSQVDPAIRSARQRNQRRAIQKYLKCPEERARELAKAWGLTVSGKTHISGRKPGAETTAERAERPPKAATNRGARSGRERRPDNRNEGRKEGRSESRSEARGEGREGRKGREGHQGNNRPSHRPENRPSTRPDPLVSGIFLSGGDAPAHSTLRVLEGESQVSVSRGPRRQGPSHSRDDSRQRRPNPLKSSTFLAREEPRSSMRELNDDYPTSQARKNSSNAEVTYKKRRTIEEQH